MYPAGFFYELNIPDKPRAREIINWAKDKIVPVKNTTVVTALSLSLDLGEAEALSLYWEAAADFLLIDEKRGRIIAHRNGIKTIGTVGIICQLNKEGLSRWSNHF